MEEDEEPTYLRIAHEDEKVKRPKAEVRYRHNYHPGKVYDLWCTGMMHPLKICALLGISQNTMGDWLTKYPEFAHQYNLGIVCGQTEWIQFGVDNITNKNISHKTFEYLVGIAFDHFKEKRKIMIPGLKNANTPEKLRKVIAELYRVGDRTAEELDLVSKSLTGSMFALGEMAKTQKRLDEVEELVRIQNANTNVGMEGDVYEVETLPVKVVDDSE